MPCLLRSTATLALLCVMGFGELRADGFRLLTQDAYAAARGEAFVATADNPSAIYYNPAGLTLLEEGHAVRTGLYGLWFEPTFRPPDRAPNAGTTYDIDLNHAIAPQLFYAWRPADRRFSLGLGLYSPHGAAVKWPEDTGFRALAISGDLLYIRLNPVLAFEVNPCFSVAAGLMIDYADLSLLQGVTAFPSANRRTDFLFEGDGVGYSFNLGALWQPNEHWSFGATVRGATTLDFEGDARTYPRFGRATNLPADVSYEFPLTATIGLSWRPTPDWDIGVDLDYTRWRSFDEVVLSQDGFPPSPVQPETRLPLGWEDSWVYKVGVTRHLPEGWHASLGYVYSGNAVPNALYSPLVADLDRQFLTVGVGRRWGDYSLDVTYQFGFASDREVSGSQPSSLSGFTAGQDSDGTYDFTSHALVVSFGTRF